MIVTLIFMWLILKFAVTNPVGGGWIDKFTTEGTKLLKDTLTHANLIPVGGKSALSVAALKKIPDIIKAESPMADQIAKWRASSVANLPDRMRQDPTYLTSTDLRDFNFSLADIKLSSQPTYGQFQRFVDQTKRFSESNSTRGEHGKRLFSRSDTYWEKSFKVWADKAFANNSNYISYIRQNPGTYSVAGTDVRPILEAISNIWQSLPEESKTFQELYKRMASYNDETYHKFLWKLF